MSDQVDPINSFDKELTPEMQALLERSGIDLENLPDGLTVGELEDMINSGAFGPDGVIYSGDHGGVIPPE